MFLHLKNLKCDFSSPHVCSPLSFFFFFGFPTNLSNFLLIYNQDLVKYKFLIKNDSDSAIWHK